KESQKNGRYVTINFDNVDIHVFIRFISELTGKNFVIDKAITGKVTIISPTKISVGEAYKVFESVLEVNGYTTVPAGSIVKIVPSVSARSKDIETRLKREISIPQDKLVTQLIPLKYADPDNLKKLFAPLISKTSVVVSYPPTGMLIVTDVLSNINRLIRIIEIIDVEGVGEEISVVPIEHATASVMAKSLNSIFQRSGRKAKKGVTGAPVIRIVPDERTNTLIILASEDDTLKVRQLIDLLDKETPRGEGDIRVFYLQNANAEDLAQVLMSIPSKGTKGTKKGKAPVVSKEVQIVADKATNSLVITSDKEDYLVLEDVIKKLDIPRRMVYIEALIMEVSMDKNFELGVRWNAFEDRGSHDGKKIGTFGGSIPGDVLNAVATGFSLGVIGEAITIGGTIFPSLSAVIRAYQSDSDVQILSTPQIMTTNNEEAEIVVGENRPFLTRQDTSTTGNVDYSNYEFKDVGITLNITPQINRERFVRLKIFQEVSKVSKEPATVGLLTTLKRTAKTTVIIKDGHTIVIGGLIEKIVDDSTYKVPFLGDIPILGWLFRSNSRTGGKTNLFIFLTPHIIENPTEAEKVYQEKKEQIDSIKEGGIKMYKGPSKQTPEQILESDEL
ncbi:MAG: type II secretion system secretin GspD, partial [Desulfobacterales bacterium]|nr:type II secretion system secretin GspD [Desulfobacterales bacterium]